MLRATTTSEGAWKGWLRRAGGGFKRLHPTEKKTEKEERTLSKQKWTMAFERDEADNSTLSRNIGQGDRAVVERVFETGGRMRTFYHCSPVLLGEGTTILPGNWGRIIKLMGSHHVCFSRESLMESTRVQMRPDAPSRLECCFALNSMEDAIQYRIRAQKPAEVIYEVETVADMPVFAAPLNIFGGRIVDQEMATFYWKTGGFIAHDVGLPKAEGMLIFWELLVSGPLRVVRQIAHT